jgi:hypothetical protein
VTFSAGIGYRVPFLNVEYEIDPERNTIVVPSGLDNPGFQTGLVLINYLLHASDHGITGRMVTFRELNGGNLFFRGPHALSTQPVIERFGRDSGLLMSKAEAIGATAIKNGDVAFRLPALPKILIAYTLYRADEEFPAELTITFDANTDRHLPLDTIWALINVVSRRLVKS